jgi:hypothetical protein
MSKELRQELRHYIHATYISDAIKIVFFYTVTLAIALLSYYHVPLTHISTQLFRDTSQEPPPSFSLPLGISSFFLFKLFHKRLNLTMGEVR